MTGGYGSTPWGGGSWGGATPSEDSRTEHIPTSSLWNGFDLMGVRQPDDMDRVQNFIEVTTTGSGGQFFVASFNMCSGGVYAVTPAILDIDVAVTETFTVEWRVAFNDLPPDFSDPVNAGILVGVNNASGPCASLMLSEAGVAYTGAFQFVAGNLLELGHALSIIPGSETWFAAGDEVYIRLVVDSSTGVASLFVTPVADIVPGVLGTTDSSGHVLRALLPLLSSATSSFAPIDRIASYVKGTVGIQVCVELFHYSFSRKALIPDLPPRAVTGADQAVQFCSIIQLDGSASFDPEGSPLVYDWRLVDAPETSEFVYPGVDGYTQPQAVPSGFTDQFFSPELALEHTVNPILVGDVLLVGGVAYTISDVPVAATVPFYVRIENPQLPDSLLSASYKVIRQVGISDAGAVKPTFYPDQPGFYVFDLRVFDGVQWSTPTGLQRTTTLLNVLESPLPRGCVPNLNFIFDYLSDFWRMVEDAEPLGVFWGALAQVAATELYTLWQHEYSKSIRDIQRTFIRRWLHYDLLLPEPVPELTGTFSVFSGLESKQFTTARVNGRTLVLESPAFAAPHTVVFNAVGGIEPVSFTEGLGRYLRQNVSLSMSTELVALTGGGYVIRIDAPFELSVGGGTTATVLFEPGAVSRGSVHGGGYATGPRTFKVDRSLQGLNLVEAFLVIGETTYVIDRVINDVSDAYPYQRVVVREPLESSVQVDVLLPASTYVVCGWVSSELLDFYNGLVSSGDIVDVEVVEFNPALSSLEQFTGLIETVAYGASKTFNGRLPVDCGTIGHFIANEELAVRLAKVTRTHRIPVDSDVVDIPVLQERIVIEDDTATLRRNLDFFIEESRGRKSVRFVAGQNNGPDVWEGVRPPERLWAEYTYLDNGDIIESNFGEAVALTRDMLEGLPETVDYLSAVSGLLYAYGNGPTVHNLRIGTQILLGLPFAEEDGVIEEIRRDLLTARGRILIRDTNNPEVVRSYTFPKILAPETNPATGEMWAVGDTVTRFDPLVEGATVVDYVKDPTWFEGLLNQGVFYEVQKYHTFAVSVDSRAFNQSSLLFARDFILRIKPTWTQPKFIVQLVASDGDGDEISVNDTITYGGSLTLEDSLCRGRFGASYLFDEPWAGGGQPWAGDLSQDTGVVRNRFDNDDDHTTTPLYPTAEQVYWGFDKSWLCPHDMVTYSVCEEFLAPFIPPFDSVFSFDLEVSEPFKADEAGPFAIPSGVVGYVFTLGATTVTQSGTLAGGVIQLLGVTGAGEADFELVVTNVTQATFELVALTTATNTEKAFSLSLAVTASDTIQVSLRTASQNAASPGWTQILLKVGAGVAWAFDVPLPAGEYCGAKELVA